MEASVDRRPWRGVALVFLGWSCYALVLVYQSALWWFAAGRRPDVWYVPPLFALGVVWTWAALTPAVVWIARRYPLRRLHAGRALAVHAAAVLLVTFITVAVEYALALLLPSGANPRYVFMYVERFDVSVFFYAGVVAVTHSIDFARAAREERLRATQLQADLAAAQLHRLRMQLQPHFLFNTLNTISAVLYRDPPAADRMLSELGDLLRFSLDEQGSLETTLGREIEIAARYARLEQVRYEDWLDIEIDADADVLSARVPSFLLQPLIENAIRHGIAPSERPGTVRIVARAEGEYVAITVADNGVGMTADRSLPGRARDTASDPGTLRPVRLGPTRSGIGLSSTQDRLRHLYGAAQSLTILSDPGRGTSVTIRIPLHPDARPIQSPAAATRV